MYISPKNIFDKQGAKNVKWVFSINAEDVPVENNHFILYYPGADYVDYVGIDGYNWGNTKSGSRWLSFKDIFEKPYNEIAKKLSKPVIISEFSSTSHGGDKATWINEAMGDIKRMNWIKAFVLFNVDKETDWGFSINTIYGAELKDQLKTNILQQKKTINFHNQQIMYLALANQRFLHSSIRTFLDIWA